LNGTYDIRKIDELRRLRDDYYEETKNLTDEEILWRSNTNESYLNAKERAGKRNVAKISDERVEEIVAQTIATMSFEGLICDEEDIAALYSIARGETTADEEVAAVIREFKMRRDLQRT